MTRSSSHLCKRALNLKAAFVEVAPLMLAEALSDAVLAHKVATAIVAANELLKWDDLAETKPPPDSAWGISVTTLPDFFSIEVCAVVEDTWVPVWLITVRPYGPEAKKRYVGTPIPEADVDGVEDWYRRYLPRQMRRLRALMVQLLHATWSIGDKTVIDKDATYAVIHTIPTAQDLTDILMTE